MDEETGSSPRVALVAGGLIEALLVPIALLLGAYLGAPPLSTLRLDLADAGIGVVAALPMFGAFVLFVRSPAAPCVRIRDALDAHLLPIFRSAGPQDVVAIAALAGIGE